MKVNKIAHLGVMAEVMEPVRRLFHDVLDLPVVHEELYKGEVDLSFMQVGETCIEVFSDNPVSGNQLVAGMIAEAGGVGIHHVALEVDDLDAAVREVRAKNIGIEDPRDGAHGTRVAFLDKNDTYGVVIELVQTS